MLRTTRALAVAVTAATLTLTGPAVTTSAAAKPADGAHAKGGKSAVAKDATRKVVRDIDRLSAALERTVRPHRVDGLADGAAVQANVALDQLDLAALRTAATDPAGTADLAQVRRDLRDWRVENYRIVVNVLRHAADVGAAADEAADAAAGALVDSAVATALTVRATTARAVLKDARADLNEAQGLLEDDADDAEDADDADDAEGGAEDADGADGADGAEDGGETVSDPEGGAQTQPVEG